MWTPQISQEDIKSAYMPVYIISAGVEGGAVSILQPVHSECVSLSYYFTTVTLVCVCVCVCVELSQHGGGGQGMDGD